ncbi:MAG: hypothetical protein ACLGGX_05560 [Bdellovibrionia bacterium]
MFLRLLYRILTISLCLQLSLPPSWSQVPTELEQVIFSGDLNARSTVDFRASNVKNRLGVVPKGAQGSVEETRRLPSGAYAVRVKIDSVPEQKNKKGVFKSGESVWVYYSQKDPWLTFSDKQGEETEDPEVALRAAAKKDGQGYYVPRRPLPTKEEVLKSSKPVEEDNSEIPQTQPSYRDQRLTPQQIEAALCTHCDDYKDAHPAVRNKSDIKSLTEKITKGIYDESDPWKDDLRVSVYSYSKQTDKAIRHAMKNKKPRPIRYCYRYVKRALLAADIVQTYPPGGHARDAMVDLKAQGMTNMLENPEWAARIKSPQDAPKGAVLVYLHKDKRRSGHIEIKTDHGTKGGFVSDFYNKNSILGNPNAGRASKRYELVGVFIR